MKKILLAIGLLVGTIFQSHTVFSETVSVQPLENDSTPLIVAIEKDYPPFLFYENGSAQGISFDYLSLVAKKMGRELQMTEPMQLQAMINSVTSGKSNILIDVTKTKDRDVYLEFTNSYIETPAIVIGRKNQASVWDAGSSNAGVTIAVGKAYGVVSFLRERYPKAQLIEVDSDSDVVKAVALGAVDVGVLDVGSYSYLLTKEPLMNLAVLGNTGFLYSLSFAVSEENKNAIPLLNSAISKISADEKAAIYAKWILTYPTANNALLSTFTKELIGGIAGAFFVIIIWNVVLRRKIKQRTRELEIAREESVRAFEVAKKAAENLQEESANKTVRLEKTKKAMLNILEDIQQDKAKLSSITRKFKIATESAQIGVMEMDISSNHIYGDDITCALYGIDEIDFDCTLEKWMSFIHPDDRARVSDKMKRSMRDGSMFEDVFRIIRLSGELRYIKGYAQIDFDENHKPLKMIGVNYDVTHEKEVDLEKTEFVSLASHQLKTPIGSISWNLEMLEHGDYGDLTATQKEIVSDMYLMSRRMNELVNSLLNVSRIELGVFIIEPEPVDFGKICDEVLLELKPRIEAKHHNVVKKYSGNIQNIPADPKLLRIIFQNYLSNAVKYTQDNGKIEVRIYTDENNVIASVWNNGDPVPEKDKAKIFGKMFRASNAQSQDPDGNGLGLYLVKKIIENGGGKAWFESTKETGTTFYISIPITGMLRKEGTKKLD